MATSFPITFSIGDNHPIVTNFPVYAGETFVAGDLVYYDTSGVRLCGADPALILGIAMTGTADAAALLPSAQVPVAILSPDIACLMSSATTPALAHLFTAYGIVRTSAGIWRVDVSDTSATRIVPYNFSPKPGVQGQEGWMVKFTAANLQGDAVAS